MRHGKKINHLSRTASHRKAMLSNMACSLIEHKRINTTLAKAIFTINIIAIFTKGIKMRITHQTGLSTIFNKIIRL